MHEEPKWMDPDYEPLHDPDIVGFNGFCDPPVFIPLRVLTIAIGYTLGLLAFSILLPACLGVIGF
jgi:hypothetical protein